MNINKLQTEAYFLTDIDRLDPVTVYVTNSEAGRGKIVIECFGSAWAGYWGGMGVKTVQQFLLCSDNEYLLGCLLKNTRETDFDEINDLAEKTGFSICVTSDVEIAMQESDMRACFGPDWMMELPQCRTVEYDYLGRILNAIKDAFSEEVDSPEVKQ